MVAFHINQNVHWGVVYAHWLLDLLWFDWILHTRFGPTISCQDSMKLLSVLKVLSKPARYTNKIKKLYICTPINIFQGFANCILFVKLICEHYLWFFKYYAFKIDFIFLIIIIAYSEPYKAENSGIQECRSCSNSTNQPLKYCMVSRLWVISECISKIQNAGKCVSSKDFMAVLQKLGQTQCWTFQCESLIQGMKTYRLVRTVTVFLMLCSTPSWLVKKHFHLQILTHYGSCEGSDSILFKASQTAQVWSSGAHWHSSPPTDDASGMHNTHFWTQNSNFLIPLAH